ncbi:hypothetical protein BGZ46_006800 [Entomortierella lignicola]|nr:hypothetical protein BGZ46_006800 [Entomortierella lignicola]
MLLLVPSHKTDEGASGKNSTSHNRVLVLLPSDTDLSSNIVVPDTAITTTLETNDTLETSNDFSISPFSVQKSVPMDFANHSGDHLGILQPSNQAHLHSHHSNIRHSLAHLDQTNPAPYSNSNIQNSVARRHSHSGLVNGGNNTIVYSRSRTKSRSSFSQSSPYQCQPVRTPRALRAAFRKARKDQSPLLTSTSFGSDFMSPFSMNNLGDNDIALLFGAEAPTTMTDGSSSRSGLSGVEYDGGISTSTYKSDVSSCPRTVLSGTPTMGATNMTHSDGHQYQAKPEMEELDSNFGLNENGDPDSLRGLTRAITRSNIDPTPGQNSKRHTRELLEVLDVEGLSDDGMGEPRLKKNAFSQAKEVSVERTEEECQDIDLENTLDDDVAMIMGMASDIELKMPKFDDEYLEDLKIDPVLVGQSRRSSTASAVSPSCSHYSSSTITFISSQPSPRSQPGTPHAITSEKGYRAESLPVSPGVLAARARMQSPISNQTSNQSLQFPQPPVASPAQDLSIIHQDIDHLKRHRDSLKQTSEMMAKSLSKSASCSSPFTSTSERKNQAPIYFKPSHHSLPVGSSPSECSRQNVMLIQSNRWTSDNKDNGEVKAYPTVSLQEDCAMQGNGGSQMFRAQGPSQPPQPRPTPNEMTASNISLATANMSVLTPQEVQEDYYTRQNLRIYQQRQRRKSTILDNRSGIGLSTSNSEGFLPWTRRFSASDIHPLEKSIVPAIGTSPLPASYYIPPSAFRTEAAVAAEKEAERKRREQEEETFLVFPSPTLS